MSVNIKVQTTARVQASPYYALQMDESTDTSNHAILLVYVRHILDGDLQQQFLCSRDLPTTTKAEDIFNSVDMYLSSVGLSWEYCVGITTDGCHDQETFRCGEANSGESTKCDVEPLRFAP